ncbi:DUF4381 domain-containing protein [Aurantivibrio infirmus]
MNEEDPLANLRDIALPDPISFWPPAPGWWIILFLSLSLIICSAIYFRRHRLKTAYRRKATNELSKIWQSFQDNNDPRLYLEEISKLIRRCAIVAYPRKNFKNLSGAPWLEFLDITYAHKKNNAFTKGLSADFSTLVFQNDIALSKLDPNFFQSLHLLASDWCKEHLTEEKLDNILRKNNSDSKLDKGIETGANNVAV